MPLIQSLIYVTSFRFSKSFYYQSILFKHTNNFYSAFPNPLDRKIDETKFHIHTRQVPPPPIFYCTYHINFPFDAQNVSSVRDCSHVNTLPVSCQLQG